MSSADDLSKIKTPERARRGKEVVFGYQHVQGVPNCPCQDPGNYMMMERADGQDLLRCWCGRTMRVTFDSEEERSAWIKAARGG